MNIHHSASINVSGQNGASGDGWDYMSGFGNSFETEALAGGALPIGRNSPQRAPYWLYVEQRAAIDQRAVVALPDNAERQALRPLSQG